MSHTHTRKRSLAIMSTLAASVAFVLGGCASEAPASTAIQAVSENGAPSPSEEEIFTPIVASALADPIPVEASDGLEHLAYELFITNVMGQQVTVNALSVLGDGEELLQLGGEDLMPWMRAMGSPSPGTVLAAGQSATIILDVTVPEGTTAPQTLSHVIEFSPETAMPPMVTDQMQQTIAPVPVSDGATMVIGSPVVGDGWLDGNGCCEASPHRSAINPVNGALHAPERFAIDFVQLDAESRIFDGAIDEISSYAYFGADIVAVGDGPVVSMKWDLPDETPGAHPDGLELNEYGGNHVVQDIGDGHYAFYAHLQGTNPAGLTVGQNLSRGDMIGHLGNSGNTDMPHLHFHVMDSPLPLASNGLPFAFESFALTGTVSSTDLVACMSEPISCNVDGSGDTEMDHVMPLERDVISVSDSAK